MISRARDTIASRIKLIDSDAILDAADTMPANPFILVAPATRGISLALTRHFLRTTNLPVFGTYRSDTTQVVKDHILFPLKEIDPSRLTLLPLDLTSEESISYAAGALSKALPKDSNVDSYLHTAFFTGGVLHPEKQPADLDLKNIQSTFQINVISHLLLIKHFSQFLPNAKHDPDVLTKWVHMTARVGSISDNKRGGWYSYRSSKAALSQVVKTFDLQMQMKNIPGICVGVHPGTGEQTFIFHSYEPIQYSPIAKTDLSKGFWKSVPSDKLFTPECAAERLVDMVQNLNIEQRGKVWDWAGKEVPW